MAAKKKTTTPYKSRRGGRDGMVLELDPKDRGLLDALVERYKSVVQSPNKAFVIRQLIRNAHESTKLPALKLP